MLAFLGAFCGETGRIDFQGEGEGGEGGRGGGGGLEMRLAHIYFFTGHPSGSRWRTSLKA